MIKVGILGFGFMGRMHFKCYKTLDNVHIVAICDTDKSKFDKVSVIGNIPGTEQSLDLTEIKLFTDFDNMLKQVELDCISITLPTYMHRDFTIKALEAGIHVLCEKPMALDEKQCQDMIATAKKSGKVLQIGHCIRFWPEYAKTKQIIQSGEYGRVLVATFRRLSSAPEWSWNNWMLETGKSGGALIDLHIHDTDFVQYVFGTPKMVRTAAIKGPSGDFDHLITQYIYDDEKIITAEGGWMMAPGFGFEMSFNIILEKATITYDCTRKPTLKIYPIDGEAFTPEVETNDGYLSEITYFIKKVVGQKVPEIITPTDSLNSIKLVLAEKQSANSGKEVTIQ